MPLLARLRRAPAVHLRLTYGGRVYGDNLGITHNDPWPCVNGSWGSGAIQGVVMHTMVGNLPGTEAVFNNPTYQASAHFGIAQDGHIHQFGPIGQGWVAWAEENGNGTWYSIEHADNGNPDIPLTPEQITASAQLLEFLSRYAGFSLREANETWGSGYGVHYMGGASWGGHTCPDEPPYHVRSHQRPAIIAQAKLIRVGRKPKVKPKPKPKPQPPKYLKHVTSGAMSLVNLSAGLKTTPLDVIWATALNVPPQPEWSAYVDAGDLKTVKIPAGITLFHTNPVYGNAHFKKH